jgi:hypothetical protein
MAQLVRKRWKSSQQIQAMSYGEKLKYREELRIFREKTLRRLATDLTLTHEQKVDLLIDYQVGVPLE